MWFHQVSVILKLSSISLFVYSWLDMSVLWQPVYAYMYIYVYRIRTQSFIAVPVDALKPNSARPSVGTVLTVKLDIHFFLNLSYWLFWICFYWAGRSILHGLQNLAKSCGTSIVNPTTGIYKTYSLYVTLLNDRTRGLSQIENLDWERWSLYWNRAQMPVILQSYRKNRFKSRTKSDS